MTLICIRDRAAGFTLIEVSLAVLVVGLGLLAVFSLFPSGLRSAEEGSADTRCGMFAETVMNGLHGNAASITNWADWCSSTNVADDLISGVLGADVRDGGIETSVIFPAGGIPQYIRYKLTLTLTDPDQYSALLEVVNGQYGSFANPALFYTEFTYQGM
jgi:prepilin-type N-terminal cleavage/methylation domain-containing protein